MAAFWTGILVLVFACYLIVRRDARKVGKVLERLALERDGRVRSPFGSYPQLTFPNAGVDLLVSAMPGSSGAVTGNNSSPQTFAQLHLRSVPDALFFRVRSKSTQTAGERLFGLRDEKLGDAGFDDRFVVEAQDVDRLRELLSPEVRKRIIDLDRGRGVRVALERVKLFNGNERPRLDVAIDQISTERQDYVDLIETALSLQERIDEATKHDRQTPAATG